MSVHELKVWPEFFDALWAGTKKFELRKNDRNYKQGDLLRLREWSQSGGYTGREESRRVTYLLSGDDPTGNLFGVRQGFVCMSLED